MFYAIREAVLATEENYLAKDNESIWNSMQFPKSYISENCVVLWVDMT